MKHKLTEQELDTALRKALLTAEEPGDVLNQKILRRAKEATGMNKKMRKLATAVAAGVLLFTGVSVSVYAGVKYLTPQEVADEMGGYKDEVKKAFEGDGAVYVNETKEFDGGTVTFLGIAQGSGVNALTGEMSADNNRSYAVFAFDGIGDGSDVHDMSGIFVSPFIKGLAPWQYNAWTIGGDDAFGGNGKTEIVRDGVRYQILECGNVEMFADRGVYMGVSYEMAGSAFEMNEETGEIQAKAEYAGKAALFTVPFDTAKADPAAADEIIEKIRKDFAGEDNETDGKTGSASNAADDSEAFPMGKWDAKRVQAEGKLLENTVSVVQADSSGRVTYPAWETEKASGEGGGFITVEALFPDNKTGMSDMMLLIGTGEDTLLIETFTLNEDGTITFAVYEAQR